MEKKSLGIFCLVALSIMVQRFDKASYAQIPLKNGSYYSGIYRNLFADLLGKNNSEVKSKLDSTFHQLFFGNDNTQRVYYHVGSDMAYIEDIGDADVSTEGMSYGMMIAVQMDKKDVFDKLWKWAITYMQLKSGPHKGYFAWHCKMNGT